MILLIVLQLATIQIKLSYLVHMRMVTILIIVIWILYLLKTQIYLNIKEGWRYVDYFMDHQFQWILKYIHHPNLGMKF